MSERLSVNAIRLETWFEDGAWTVANLMAMSVGPIVLTDLHSTIFYANPAFCRRWGYADEGEVIGRPLSDVVNIDGDAVATAGLGSVEWRQTESTAVCADGSEFNVDMAVGIIRNAGGESKACMVSFVDVSEILHLEKELSGRFKEFICLYTVGSLAENTGLTLAGIGRETADLLPVSCRYPEKTCARVRLYSEDYCTVDYVSSECRLSCDIKINDRVCGVIEIGYTGNTGDDSYEFSDKERLMVEAVASRIGRIMELRETQGTVARSEAQLRERNWHLTILNQISAVLGGSLDLTDVFSQGLKALVKEVGLSGVVVYLADDENNNWEEAASLGDDNIIIEALHNGGEKDDINQRVTRSRRVIVSEGAGGQRIVSVPLEARGELLGILHVSAGEDIATPRSLKLLKSVGRLFGTAVESTRMIGRIKHQSVTDELTGISNRRRFYEVLALEAERAQRYRRTFTLVMIDLDGFKECNDMYGHDTGDKVLRDFADLLVAELRRSDVPFRQGGDEFAIILPETEASAAQNIIDRIRRKWRRLYQDSFEEMAERQDFSAGIGLYPEHSETIDELIRIVDSALYMSKRSGKGITTMVDDMDGVAVDFLGDATGQQIYALAATVDAKDTYTYGHSERVAALSISLGEAIGLSRSEIMELKAASLLHDIGKVGIPDAILTKPGKLDAAEYEQIKKHPAEGARIIGLVKELSGLVPAIRHHHERWDGGGYPDGLLGEQIPLPARIITIADSYDAITSARTYKDAMSGATAISEIEAGSGSQFDPKLAGVFIGIISQPENS